MGVGQVAGGGLRPHRDHRAGRGRHPLPQTRADRLRHRHAPRSADLQPGQAPGQLGARLGRLDADRRAIPSGLPTKVWSLPLGFRLYRNRQGLTKGKRSAEIREGQEVPETPARPQPPHPAGIGRGTDFPGGRLVSRAETAGQRRQRLRRGERPAEAAGQRRPDQPRPSEGGFVRAGPAPPTARGVRPRKASVCPAWRPGPTTAAALADVGLRPVRPARHAAGQDAPGAVLQGGQGSALDDRAGPRRRGQASRPDVLLHASGLGRAADPLGLCRRAGRSR